MPQLPLAIEHFLLTSLTPENCCEALENVLLANAGSLASLCMHVLKARCVTIAGGK